MSAKFGVNELFDAGGFAPMLGDLNLKCLDVGARHGFVDDLLPIAGAVHAIGFEPDEEEARRLGEKSTKPWRSYRILPVALGQDESRRTLFVHTRRGCSSLLEVNKELCDAFGRREYAEVDERFEVRTATLDSAAERYDFKDASYIKIDIQGAELEVFESGRQLIGSSMVAIRCEVSFIPIYQKQPLFFDIASHLYKQGFHAVDFVLMHSWRRVTRRKFPMLADGPFPYSRGELAHGDLLFLKDTAVLLGDGFNMRRVLSAAMIALCYGHVDYAAALLGDSRVRQHVQSTYSFDVVHELERISRSAARNHWPSHFAHRLSSKFFRKSRNLG